MFKTRILIKIALFILLYGLCYYLIPLPSLAFLGFLFPLVYLYADMKKMKYIQPQFIFGFGGGLFLASIIIKLSAVSFYFGFMSMSLCFLLSFYFSFFNSWMKLPLILFSAVSSMIFNLVVDGSIEMVPGLYEKFIFSILLSVCLYGFIDKLLGGSVYIYFPKGMLKKIGHNAKQNIGLLLSVNEENIYHTISVYIAILSLLVGQVILGLPGSLCSVAAGSIIVVTASDHEKTKMNILLRSTGALLGIVIACLQLTIVAALPFFFMHLGLLILVMLGFAYFILDYPYAANLLPQAAITYLTVVLTGFESGAQLSPVFLRVIGILLGVALAYIVSLFFFSPKKKIESTITQA